MANASSSQLYVKTEELIAAEGLLDLGFEEKSIVRKFAP